MIVAQRYRMYRRHGHSPIYAALLAPPLILLLSFAVAVGVTVGLWR
jgi:hypothetical protein